MKHRYPSAASLTATPTPRRVVVAATAAGGKASRRAAPLSPAINPASTATPVEITAAAVNPAITALFATSALPRAEAAAAITAKNATTEQTPSW